MKDIYPLGVDIYIYRKENITTSPSNEESVKHLYYMAFSTTNSDLFLQDTPFLEILSEKKDNTLKPYYPEVLLHLLNELVIKKSKIEELAGVTPNFFYLDNLSTEEKSAIRPISAEDLLKSPSKPIDFDNLYGLDFDYDVDESYSDWRQVRDLAKEKGIPSLRYKNLSLPPSLVDYVESLNSTPFGHA
jgi:hypothetical protein